MTAIQEGKAKRKKRKEGSFPVNKSVHDSKKSPVNTKIEVQHDYVTYLLPVCLFESDISVPQSAQPTYILIAGIQKKATL